MGNRAVIRAEGNCNKGVYLHWNGGRDSIEAFLKYCELRGFREFDDDYGMARFCQVVGNFFGGGLSLGITECTGGCGDNGVYVVKGWEIVGREDFKGSEQKEHDLQDMLKAIDKAQPISQQLGDFLNAEEVPTNTIKIGDQVYIQELDETYKKYEVIGIGKDEYRNGHKALNIPYVNKYNHNGDYSWNCNNYIWNETVKKVKK